MIPRSYLLALLGLALIDVPGPGPTGIARGPPRLGPLFTFVVAS